MESAIEGFLPKNVESTVAQDGSHIALTDRQTGNQLYFARVDDVVEPEGSRLVTIGKQFEGEPCFYNMNNGVLFARIPSENGDIHNYIASDPLMADGQVEKNSLKRSDQLWSTVSPYFEKNQIKQDSYYVPLSNGSQDILRFCDFKKPLAPQIDILTNSDKRIKFSEEIKQNILDTNRQKVFAVAAGTHSITYRLCPDLPLTISCADFSDSVVEEDTVLLLDPEASDPRFLASSLFSVKDKQSGDLKGMFFVDLSVLEQHIETHLEEPGELLFDHMICPWIPNEISKEIINDYLRNKETFLANCDEVFVKCPWEVKLAYWEKVKSGAITEEVLQQFFSQEKSNPYLGLVMTQDLWKDYQQIILSGHDDKLQIMGGIAAYIQGELASFVRSQPSDTVREIQAQLWKDFNDLTRSVITLGSKPDFDWSDAQTAFRTMAEEFSNTFWWYKTNLKPLSGSDIQRFTQLANQGDAGVTIARTISQMDSRWLHACGRKPHPLFVTNNDFYDTYTETMNKSTASVTADTGKEFDMYSHTIEHLLQHQKKGVWIDLGPGTGKRLLEPLIKRFSDGFSKVIGVDQGNYQSGEESQSLWTLIQKDICDTNLSMFLKEQLNQLAPDEQIQLVTFMWSGLIDQPLEAQERIISSIAELLPAGAYFVLDNPNGGYDQETAVFEQESGISATEPSPQAVKEFTLGDQKLPKIFSLTRYYELLCLAQKYGLKIKNDPKGHNIDGVPIFWETSSKRPRMMTVFEKFNVLNDQNDSGKYFLES